MTRPRPQLLKHWDELDSSDAKVRSTMPHQSPPVDRTPPSRKQRRKRKRAALPDDFAETVANLCDATIQLAYDFPPGFRRGYFLWIAEALEYALVMAEKR